MMFFHRLCVALSRREGRVVALSLLPSFPPPSEVVFPPFFVIGSLVYLSFLPLSSNAVVLPFLGHLAPLWSHSTPSRCVVYGFSMVL